LINQNNAALQLLLDLPQGVAIWAEIANDISSDSTRLTTSTNPPAEVMP
jgi:hypothetical protein